MKKAAYLCLVIAFCIMLFSACAGNADKNSGSATDQTQTSDLITTTPQGEESQTDSSIIAKSSNTVSDKEKEEILNELSGELDDALNNVNDLKDVEDSDLDVNSID